MTTQKALKRREWRKVTVEDQSGVKAFRARNPEANVIAVNYNRITIMVPPEKIAETMLLPGNMNVDVFCQICGAYVETRAAATPEEADSFMATCWRCQNARG